MCNNCVHIVNFLNYLYMHKYETTAICINELIDKTTSHNDVLESLILLLQVISSRRQERNSDMVKVEFEKKCPSPIKLLHLNYLYNF